jgi:hypothetical protein
MNRISRLKRAKTPDDEATLTADIIALATQYGRYGYRRITAILRNAGWVVNFKRVERIWGREGLKVPHKQPKRGRLWLNDGSRIRLRPEHPTGRAHYDRGIIPQLSLVLYMRQEKLCAAPTPSMLRRSGNSPLHPSEIFHRLTVVACPSRREQAPARDYAAPDCDQSEAQFLRFREGSRVAPIVCVALLHGSPLQGRSWAAFSWL